MSYRLLINPGTPQEWTIELRPGVNRIGRTEDNDFTINHTSISTHHCEITVNDSTVVIKDLGSTNGTFVEQVPVTEFQLQNGHHLQLGAVQMTVDVTGPLDLPEAVNQPGEGARIVLANPGPAIPPPPVPPGLRINRPATPTSAATPPLPPNVGRSFTPGAGVKSRLAEKSAAEPGEQKYFIRGVAGAIVGGVLGMFLWYFLIKVTGYEIGWVAWGVGVIVGFAARLPSKQGSQALGLICGGCALIAILGGQYFALLAIMDKEITKMAAKDYREEMQVAQTAVNAKSPDEIRQFLASQNEKSPDQVSAADVKEFTETELPDYRAFVNGKPSREEYIANMKKVMATLIPKSVLFKESFGMLTLLWIFLGVGTAWKIGSGQND
jgi:hypothetical protein